MFRNQYDSDITTWSPQGRIHQIEYAMEAVKQGMPAVGLKSKTHAIVATVKRSSSELASYQKKIFKIDEHMGIAIAGLTADARVLCKYMRSECLNHKFVYNTPLQVGRLVRQVSDKSQVHTQRAGRRPFGLGMLVIGYDQTGTHLYETCPSGNYFEYKAQSIGSRSQSAKTYLEKTFLEYENASLDELIRHSLLAIRETLGSGNEGLSIKNCSVGVVGENLPYTILEGADLQAHLNALENDGGNQAEVAPMQD
eukprot:TRINITY_DN8128_c0_g1_i1.p1 TRINITY_DN8128_c0_g1~~TRINITY_DN8128_c0_g1_i1.p1  ORF type:complete len:253 (+),score=32.35 TRINITY_DN8128_c0_g1_i1:39-797(+)